MAVPLLNSKPLGNVTTINMIKNANIESMPLPRNNSENTKLFDFNGATKTITVTGTLTNATDAATLKTASVDVIEAYLSGNQTAVTAFVSDLTGSINVFVQSFQWDWNVAVSEVAVNYTLELIQGVKGGQ